MKNQRILGNQIVLTVFDILGLFVLAATLRAQEIPATSPVTGDTLPAPVVQTESDSELLRDSYQALLKGNRDVALDKVNQVIAVAPHNKQARMIRASIYGEQEQYDKAAADYQAALDIDPKDTIAKFNLAELNFMQKKYDEARAGFDAVRPDESLGDFATFKVLLCDLLGAHEEAASKDLDALNQVGGNPSYYFGNVAWNLVHHKPADAADWLKTASRIYAQSPQKFANYTHSLISLGYLPIHLSSAQ